MARAVSARRRNAIPVVMMMMMDKARTIGIVVAIAIVAAMAIAILVLREELRRARADADAATQRARDADERTRAAMDRRQDAVSPVHVASSRLVFRAAKHAKPAPRSGCGLFLHDVCVCYAFCGASVCLRACIDCGP